MSIKGRHLNWAQWPIFVLALVIPVLLLHSYNKQKDLLHHESIVKKSLREERTEMVDRVLLSDVSTRTEGPAVILIRDTAEMTVSGTGPFVTRTEFEAIRSGIQSSPNAHWPQWASYLQSPDRLVSGLPKRYVGLLELMACQAPDMDPELLEAMYTTAEDLWFGRDLSDAWWAFCLMNLPPTLRDLYPLQLQYLGTDLNSMMPLIRMTKGPLAYLIQLTQTELDEINHTLDLLDLELELVATDQFHAFGNVHASLIKQPRSRAITNEIRLSAVNHWAIFLSVEALLFLIWSVLRQYRRLHHFQRQLLAAAPHELRTPLAVIRQFTEMLEERSPDWPNKHRNYLNHIHRQTLKMQYLIENLLFASRIEDAAPQVNPTEINARDYLTSIVDALPWGEERNLIDIQVTPIQVCWDAHLFEQVIINILENAHIHAGTKIDLKLESRHGVVLLTVRDYGKTLTPQKLPRIGAFRRGNQHRAGLGLGLHISNRIVQAHGGQLHLRWADPGLKVEIQLPNPIATETDGSNND